MPSVSIAGNVKPAIKLKARLDETRHEETWHVPVENLLRKCKIPMSNMHSVKFDTDTVIKPNALYEADSEDTYDVLVIIIARDSIKDKKRKKRRKS